MNAADAFDIGSFDEDDVKGIKLSESDQEIYTAFNHVNSERWQQEIAGMVCSASNADKVSLSTFSFVVKMGQDEMILTGRLGRTV